MNTFWFYKNSASLSKSISLVMLLIWSLNGLGQDLSGYWQGYASQGNSAFRYGMNLNQTGNSISGTATIISISSGSYGIFSVDGSVNNGIFQFQYTGVIADNSPASWYWCDLFGDLDFNLEENKLRGHWQSSNCGNSGNDTLHLWRLGILSDTLQCQSDSINLVVQGGDVRWYSDISLNNLIAQGPTYEAALGSVNFPYSSKLYVTQTYENVESPAYPVHYTMRANPEVELGPDFQLAGGQQEILNVQAPGLIYEWSTGETKSAIIISSPGTYFVTVTDSFGCTASDTVLVLGATNLESWESTFSLFPNPSSATFHLQATLDQPSPVTLTVFNQLGQIVWQHQETQPVQMIDQQINLSTQPDGIYSLRISNGRGIISRQLLVQR